MMAHSAKVVLAAGLGAFALAVVSLCPSALAAERVVPQNREQIEYSYAPLVKKVAPAVVNIYTRRVVRENGVSPFAGNPFFRQFFGNPFLFGAPRERIERSLGSGVILDPGGLIVTNFHVIRGAQEITVALSDRREFPAKIVLADPHDDLAVLRIQAGAPLPFLKLRNSNSLEVGDLVLAIGDPFGVGQTVTSGIISGLGRTLNARGPVQSYIQTDAAINPGNSGGALVTMDGRLAGINSAIYSKDGGSLGIGFAIPSNLVAAVLRSAKSGGHIARPWFGAEGQEVTARLAESLGLDRPKGVLISSVYMGGPAAAAGLKVGDVVLSVNGEPVDSMSSLRFQIETLEIGHRVALAVWRGRQQIPLSLELKPAPEIPPPDTTRLAGNQPLAGATVANMSPALAQNLGLPSDVKGVIVLGVAPGSVANRIGLQPNDMVRGLNGTTVQSVAELKRLVRAPRPEWQLQIERGGRLLSVSIRG